jgi:hypothetical protein
MDREIQGRANPALAKVYYQLKAKGAKDQTTNPLRSGIHTRGYLPHVKKEGASYFVTFRLADALPREVLLRFERERVERLRQAPGVGDISGNSPRIDEVKRDFRREVERYLDRGAGSCFLKSPEVGSLVAGVLRHFDGVRISWRIGL